MEIELKQVTVRELAAGYQNDDENGVIGFNHKLNIRPKYQREYVYNPKQRDSVIATVRKSYPLNVLYWAVNEDETFEVMDGQQRTISICEFVKGKFSIDNEYFHTLTQDQQDQILDYKLMIYFCTGKDSEKLDWFKTINIAGLKLSDQELRNAVYTGPWLTDAKKYFSKTGCAAYQLSSDLLRGTPNRQDYLETVLDWISGGTIESYMANSQTKPTAIELWNYFSSVINWVRSTFPTLRRKEMQGLPWGELYNHHKDQLLDPTVLEAEITQLMQDDEVTNKRGIYAYVLDRKERHLSLRSFDNRIKREVFERQAGICPKCPPGHAPHPFEGTQADHITPWSKGGRSTVDNCQLLCNDCNRRKSNA